MFDIATYTASDELPVREIWMQAFDTPAEYWPVFTQRIGAENIRTIKADGAPVGLLGVYRMGQWFGGRCVPCGGYAAVAIAPEHRQRGAAKLLLTTTLQQLRENGVPLAALYPSSQAVYRAVGFEQAGSRCSYELPLRHIGLNDRRLPAHRLPTTDAAPFVDVYRQQTRSANGNLERTPGLWERLLQNPHGHPQYAYVVEEHAAATGYVIYYLDDAGPHEPTKIFIRDWCALSAAAAARLWTLIADHGSIVEAVNWFGPANDPLLAHVAECKPTKMNVQRWMLRIVDVAAALQARGYPDVTGELHLDVSDPLIPENSGRYVLSVRSGAAAVEPGGRSELVCDVRGLAPLYSGMYGPDVLARLGWLSASPASIRTAATLFSGPEPWMPEYF